ncbi:MAG TPA: type I-E CRISPR-associated protein Cse1/CasA [Candidatus Deferrimicrobiaceae bacterium]
MSRFNLIDEKWIPVCFRDGRREELGIRDVLLHADEIAGIEDGSPLVVASLYRFLLAVLYRALEGPTDIDEAKDLFNNGFPAEKITAYLEKWSDRFWLFHEEHPFGQVPSFEPTNWRMWSAIAIEHNADNAKIVFDHVSTLGDSRIDDSSAARWLLASLTFSVSSGKSEIAHTKDAPSTGAMMVIPIGKSMRETLASMLVPETKDVVEGDLPIWERKLETVASLRKMAPRGITGFADRYSWLSRAIRFKDDGMPGVSRLGFASGVNCDVGSHRDPMLAYKTHDKFGLLPVQFHGRGVWRNFDSLLPGGDEERGTPAVIQHAIRLSGHNVARLPTGIIVLGLSNTKAKIDFWRMERFALPTALASHPDVRADIRSFLDAAEQTQNVLLATCRAYAGDLISRGNGRPDQKDVSAFISQMPCLPRYWSMLEGRFQETLQSFTCEADPFRVEMTWISSVHKALIDAWECHKSSIDGGDAWSIRALVKSERKIFEEGIKLKRRILELEEYLRKEES